MKPILLVAAFFLCVITARATDFKGQVTPVLQKYCYKCHSEIQKKEKGKLVMDNVTRLATKIGPSAIIKPGDPDGSTHVISIEAYEAALQRFDYAQGCADAMIMTVLMLAVIVAVTALRSRLYTGATGGKG